MRQLEFQTQRFIIPTKKLEVLLDASSIPSRSEVAREYRNRNEKAVFEYAFVGTGAMAVDSSEVSDRMIVSYYEAHQDSFVEGERADMYFVKIPKAASARDETACRRQAETARLLWAYHERRRPIRSLRVEKGVVTLTDADGRVVLPVRGDYVFWPVPD